jgi:hypothetical protein
MFRGAIAAGRPTVGQAIQEQREINRQQQRRDTDRHAAQSDSDQGERGMRQQMEAVVTVALGKLQLVSHNTYRRVFEMDLVLSNKGDKDIKGVKGTVVFKDVFGDDIMPVALSYDKGVKAHSSTTWKGGVDYNEFVPEHKKLATVDSANVTIDFQPDAIVFSDGSKLSSAGTH